MWFFSRKGASGFSSSSTAEEVTQGIDGTGITAIVTGPFSSGMIFIFYFLFFFLLVFSERKMGYGFLFLEF